MDNTNLTTVPEPPVEGKSFGIKKSQWKLNFGVINLIVFEKVPKDKVPLDLLLLADPEKNIIEKYLNGSVFIAAKNDDTIVGITAIKKIDKQSIEIVNLAVNEKWQNKKIGRKLLEEAIIYAKTERYKQVIVRTGNSSISQISLYQKLGFRITNVNKDYFLDNYTYVIYEKNIQCRDQVELEYRIYPEEQLEKIIKDYWNTFIEINPQYKDRKYEVWSFGYGNYQANYLLSLVRQNIKSGTSSALELYEENEKVPEQNDISIITYGDGLPGCIIETVEIKIKKFDEINEYEALLEGEGNFSLEMWRNVHQNFFTKEYLEMGKEFHNKIPVIYERFTIVYDQNRKL